MRAHVDKSSKILEELGRSDFDLRYLAFKSTALLCERAIERTLARQYCILYSVHLITHDIEVRARAPKE